MSATHFDPEKQAIVSGIVYDILETVKPGPLAAKENPEDLILIRRPNGYKSYIARRISNRYGNTAMILAPAGRVPAAESQNACGVKTLGPDDLIRTCFLPIGHAWPHDTGR
jgi:hypothetical protein